MTTKTNPNLEIRSMNGNTHSLDDLTTMFAQLWIILPSRAEAKDFEDIANEIFKTFGDSDARCAILIPGDERGAKLVKESMDVHAQYFLDIDFKVCDALGVSALPALVHIRQDTSVANIANGFDLEEWNKVCKKIADALRWTTPNFNNVDALAPVKYPVK